MANKYVSEKEITRALEEEELIKDDVRYGGLHDEDYMYYRYYLYEQYRKKYEEFLGGYYSSNAWNKCKRQMFTNTFASW